MFWNVLLELCPNQLFFDDIFTDFAGITANAILLSDISVLSKNVLKHFEILRNEAQKPTNIWLINFQGNQQHDVTDKHDPGRDKMESN